ncbi:amino acid adenylation domain-containing protein [Pseudochelatococcus sp. B33]
MPNLVSKTLGQALVASAESDRGITYITSGKHSDFLTYAELYGRARRWLHRLRQAGAEPGDEVLIVTDDVPLFTAVFWACVLGRIVAVPVSTPTGDEGALKILHIWQVLDRPWLVADARVANRVGDLSAKLGERKVRSVAEIKTRSIAAADADCEGPCADVVEARPGDLAFVQFSSGSTGTPKGVKVTHANLAANCAAGLERAGRPGTRERFVSWMPLTHDFGIIWFHIMPTLFGIDHGIIPTKVFVRNPLIWMQAASDLRATITGGPNFSYRHFLKHFDPATTHDWDLSSLRVIMNGAEPISCALAHEFQKALHPYKLPQTAITPAYGLAEGTLVVSMAPPEEELVQVVVERDHVSPGSLVREVAPASGEATEPGNPAMDFADTGHTISHVQVRIADDEVEQDDGVVGRIQIRGASVTSGYYNNEAATAAAFTSDGWLDTGDLGFTRNGRLVVTGRRKDVIILNGVNYYPQDIERVASGVSDLDLNMVVACAIPRKATGDEREHVALFVLHRRDTASFAPLAADIRATVLREMGIPVDYVLPVARIPKTTSGKVQRFQLVQRFIAGEFRDAQEQLAAIEAADGADLRAALAAGDEARLKNGLRDIAGRIVAGAAIADDRPLMECGFTSLRLVELARRLTLALPVAVPVTLLFEKATVGAIAQALLDGQAAGPEAHTAPERAARTGGAERRIAVTGLALRLPGGVETPEAFRAMLQEGRDAITARPAGRWPALPAGTYVTDNGGYLTDIETFPARFFNLTPVEAEAVDPQQRLLLMTAWEALEDAGIDPTALKDTRTGVYVGVSAGDYVQAQARTGRLDDIGPYAFTGTIPSVAAGRVAYVLGLQGPVLAVDTACSSSLVALHLAVRALRNGECERAVVAGVNLILSPEQHVGLSRMNALSPDGRCKTFDASADGYGRGEGCVALVLERVREETPPARVLAYVRGTAINHDGASNGLTAPNGAAQRAVIAGALADAGLSPADVSYVETHGTGTPLGDPIELAALAEVYRQGGGDKLLIGAVKTNIGHCEAAAGLAGVAKVLVSMEAGLLPATLHQHTPNPIVPWTDMPVAVVDRLQPWRAGDGQTRRAGVSAFGMSGTNAHVVLEHVVLEHAEEPAAGSETPPSVSRPVVLPLAARFAEDLAPLADRYAKALAKSDAARLHDLARTAACGRAAFGHRIAVVGTSADDLVGALRTAAARAPASRMPSKLVFLLPGQGAHAPEVVQHLYDHEPVFRDTLRAAEAALADHLDRPLTRILLGGEAELLARTRYNQPASVALSLAVVALLRSFGIAPDAIVGHSVGEIAAAAIGGLTTATEALRFAALRGAAMDRLPGGAMAAVQADAATVADSLDGLGEAVCVAAWNSPRHVTLSGTHEGIAEASRRLAGRGCRVAPLPVSHAFHSAMMDDALAEIGRAGSDLPLADAACRIVSSLTAAPLLPDDLRDGSHWVRHARQPVAFAGALAAVAEPDLTFIDLGVRPVLAPLCAATLPGARVLPCFSARAESATAQADETLLRLVAALYEDGHAIAWPGVFAGRPGRIAAAPTYPFQGRTAVLPTSRSAISATPAMQTPVMQTPLMQTSAPPHAAPNVPPASPAAAHGAVSDTIKSILRGIAGLAAEEIEPDASWFSLGLDSLLVVQLQQALAREYRIELPLAEVMEHGDTLNKLTGLVAGLANIAPATAPEIAANAAAGLPQTVAPPPAAAVPPPAAATDSGVSGLMALQIEAMSRLFEQQLGVIRAPVAAPPAPVAQPQTPPLPSPAREVKHEVKGLFKADRSQRKVLDAARAGHVARLAEAFNARTRASKAHTATFRDVYANPRAVIGFRPEWKELNYPLHVESASGAWVCDMDGHRYLDITMGFGVTLFGHDPAFVRKALHAEINAGYPVGPQTPRAGRIARKIREMTGAERVAFFTTGSEAVMVALRLARARTDRQKIVIFVNSYHGTFDGLLAAGWADGERINTMPVSDGTPEGMVEDVIVLRYGDRAALDVIARHADRIAAVVVEPVQSRDPAVQPREFLHDLRRLTEARGNALIFDETITGFRVHPAGAQHHFGVRADIVTYGKVIGGGLPIGVVTGRAHYLDAVDGGNWTYGDDSVPSARTAFVAGTFNAHPLTMAAAEATLDFLKERGPALQEALNARTAAMCDELNAYFAAEDLPIRMVHFSSLFRFDFADDTEILNYHLLKNGVFVWEGRNCFLSTAHGDEEVRFLIDAVKKSVDEMREGGWLPPRDGDGPAPEPASGILPLGRGQREIRALIEAHAEATFAYNEMIAFALTGPLDIAALRRALARLVSRHDILRAVRVDDAGYHLARDAAVPFVEETVAGESGVEERLARELASPFDLASGPFVRALLLAEEGAARHVFALIVHHIVADGWSLGLLATELSQLYAAERRDEPARLQPATPFSDFVAWTRKLAPDDTAAVSSPVLFARTGALPQTGGGRLHRRASRDGGQDVFARVRDYARAHEVTPFTVLLAGYALLLGRLGNQLRVTVGVPVAGHAAASQPVMVGMASTVLPLTLELAPDASFAALVAETHRAMNATRKQVNALLADAEPEHSVHVNVLFNLDRGFALAFDGLVLDWISPPVRHPKKDLFLNLMELNGDTLIDLDYDGSVADRETAGRWLDSYLAILDAGTRAPQERLAALPLSQAERAAQQTAEAGGKRVVDIFRASAPIGVAGAEQRRAASGEWVDNGELARLTPEGTVAAIGPADAFARSLAGLRDLREMERVLKAHPAVEDAAVGHDGDRGLTAFIVTDAGADLAAMAAYAALGLPAHARPDAFVACTALPRRADGAVDRDALAGLEGPRVPARLLIKPRTPAEATIAGIWASVLGLPEVGVTESFFDLGGHSLKALAILSRVAGVFGRNVPLQTFFENPSVAGLAASLATAGTHAAIAPLPAARDYAPAAAQASLWMLHQFDPDLTAYNIGFVLRRADGGFDTDALSRALARLALRHESLRTALVDVDGLPRQRILPEPALALATREAGGLDADALDAIITAEVDRPFALDRASLWRVLLLRDDAPNGARAACVVTLHHAIGDVWSVGVFVRDLLAFYGEETGAAPANLPALSVQYKDCAAAAAAASHEAHLAYWRDTLAGAPYLELPADRPRPARKTYDGAHVIFQLPAAESNALKALAAAHDASAFTAVTAVFQTLLGAVTGVDDLVIGTVTAGRDHPETADQIGFFVNTLALRGRIDRNRDFRALLDATRKTMLAANEHGATPFDQVVEATGQPRDPARNPLFEVVLVMDDRDEIARLLAGTGMSLEEVDTPTAQFDLTLYVTDGPDGLRVNATYNTALFDRARVSGWMERLSRLVRDICAAPRKPLAELPAFRDEAPALLPSFHQERLWFVDRFERGVLYPEGPTYYNMPVIARVEAPLDAERLRRAAARLAARHEILRMALVTIGERPYLRVRPDAVLPVTIREGSPASGLALLEEESRRPFSLDEAPLARLTVFHERNGSTSIAGTWLALTAHHAVADKRSLHRLIEELALIYDGREAELSPAPPFSHAVAAPERRAQGDHQADAAYWQATLKDLPALVLPTNRPRPAIHTYTADRAAGWIDRETLACIDAFAAAEGLSRRDVLRACFQLLLYRLSEQVDVVMGEPVEPADDGAGALGPLSNLLPLRVAINPRESFSAFARRSAARHAQDADHATMPFDLAVLAVNPKNDMSRTALFDVLFHYDAAPAPSVRGWSRVDTGLGWGKYDLVLSLADEADGLSTSLVFNRDLFDAETGADMSERFVRLVSAAMEMPRRAVCELDIMLPGERAALLARARDVADYPQHLTLVAAFEAMAGAYEERIAVSDATRDLTYGTLNRLANRLAHTLKSAGVRSEELVGLLVGRTWHVPVGMLGILKAGGAYLPIDPTYPEDRISFMAADSGLRVLVTDQAHERQARDIAGTHLQVVVIGETAGGAGDSAEENLPARPEPHHLAYVIYTSGSTGQPKGCLIEHRNVIQLFFHARRPFSFGPLDVWTMFHSPCFDFSTWEIYGALLFGARLVIVPHALTRDPPAFLDLLASEGVTMLSQTPTAFYALIDATLERGRPPLNLRDIVFGGEALLPTRLARWRERYPEVRLVNMYGITETTVHVTFQEIGADEIADGRSVIGVPLPSYGVLLVGPDLSLQPRGIAGEILVSGHGVARGYLNRPELTAQRFIAHPSLPGVRLYRSGDLGRLGSDGELLYLGRIDDQVKIRGFRIELGEIERQLIAHPAIRDAAVVADGGMGAEAASAGAGASSGDSLTAFIALDDDARPEGNGGLAREALFHYLADKLPDYMIPAQFVKVAAIPLTPNGKADRRRLRAQGGEVLGAQSGAAPLTALQQQVAAIWCEVLDLPSVSLDDNFFELGGHSLKANQTVVRLRQRLGASLDLRDFFSSKSLRVLVELIESRAGGEAKTISPAPAAADYPLSPAQRRLFMLQAQQPELVAYNMVGAIAIDGAVDVRAFSRAVDGLPLRHEILRTRFVMKGGAPRQEILPPAPGQVFFEHAEGDEDAIDALTERAFHHVFDLAKPPLLRLHLVSRSGGEAPRATLIVNIHHVICDGWSVNVLLRDIEAFYRAALEYPHAGPQELLSLAGREPLAIQYKDYAVWQEAGGACAQDDAARAYWLTRFEEGAPVLELPTDRTRPARPSGRGAIAAIVLTQELTDGLNRLARDADTGLFTVLSALVRLQLALLSGAEDIVVGTPVAGRDQLVLEDQIGFYLNMLALRGAVRDEVSFEAMLAQERALVLDAFAHQSYPFDALVETLADVLGDARAGGHQPLFDVILILQNNDPVRIDLAGARGRALRDTTVSAKYDLNYMFEEKPHLELLLEYASDLFDPPTAAAIAAQYVRLVEEVVGNPGVTIAELRSRLTGDGPLPGLRPEPGDGTADSGAASGHSPADFLNQPDSW